MGGKNPQTLKLVANSVREIFLFVRTLRLETIHKLTDLYSSNFTDLLANINIFLMSFLYQ